MAYLFLPLDDVRDRMRFGRFDLAVEDDRFAHHGRQVLRILHLLVTPQSCNNQSSSLINQPLHYQWHFPFIRRAAAGSVRYTEVTPPLTMHFHISVPDLIPVDSAVFNSVSVRFPQGNISERRGCVSAIRRWKISVTLSSSGHINFSIVEISASRG